ncbi:DUF6950 family protein [Aeromonas salmonicida]|uniref:DUF6950 family protein n=1 Tax=Aeromonas salmonicida TaxID=645 RepID=UPI003D31BD65
MTLTERIKILDKYNGRERIPSLLDCTTLVLEMTGYQKMDEILGKYDSVKSGVKFLRKYSGLNNMAEYLRANNYERVEHKFAQDFDLIVYGFHCGVYFDGYLFGVDDAGVFKYRQVNDLSELEIYRWQL